MYSFFMFTQSSKQAKRMASDTYFGDKNISKSKQVISKDLGKWLSLSRCIQEGPAVIWSGNDI